MAAKKVYSLSTLLLQEIRALITERQNQRPLGEPPMEDPGDLHQASDIFVCKAPEDGIPATNGTDVGWAECEVHFLFDDGTTAELEPTGQLLRIYNLSDTAIEADAYVLVTKTKFGQWIVVGRFDGTDVSTTSSCALVKLKSTDCLLATTNPGGTTATLKNNGSGHYTSTTNLNYGYGVGLVEFWYGGGMPHLLLSGKELMYCGNGCWSGGELTGHLTNTGTGSGSGTGTGTGGCDGRSFEVCLECVACPPVPGGGTAPTNCCLNEVPKTLYITMTCPECPCLEGSTTLTWSSVTADPLLADQWVGTMPVLCFGRRIRVRIYCLTPNGSIYQDGDWRLVIDCESLLGGIGSPHTGWFVAIGGTVMHGVVCLPFFATGTASRALPGDECCTGAFNATFAIAES